MRRSPSVLDIVWTELAELVASFFALALVLVVVVVAIPIFVVTGLGPMAAPGDSEDREPFRPRA